ncbi:MAG: hypothetical protein KDC34_15480 [Saprospiraceae bacterium]|nr:hypothetical protein [Saprospiraceae bacterium]
MRELKVFGIRHHGPGSARSLRKAIHAFGPDCLLIEGPTDADALIPYVSDDGLVPPVAMLIYDPKDFNWAGYFPFARFSPEWQALKYGLKQGIETRFIDWPMGLSWEMELAARQGRLFNQQLPKRQTWEQDPLKYMAQIAGYEDSERWWDIYFERASNELEVFEVINEMMGALRSELGHGDDSNLWREAHMRKEIRSAVKSGKERIAVVCGAWHAPALEAWEGIPASVDNQVFKGIRKRNTQASWIPWTYERLAVSSGYAAGVESPAWYRMLFDSRKEVTIRFLTKAARLLRQEKLDASSAQVIDAVRLAEGLAAMRGLDLPGIQELRESALSTFCEGATARLKLIDHKLVVGDRVGKVPGNIPQVPLMRDLEKSIKSARLGSEYESSEVLRKQLDLRVPSNRAASVILHRLIALEIPWGTRQNQRAGALGSFQENWRLKWRATFSLKVIEASVFGKTLEEAASNFLLQQAAKTLSLAKLGEITEIALLGELPKILPDIIRHLNQLAARAEDVISMMEALPVLVRVFRYGDVRQTPPADVELLVRQWIPRIALGLPASCTALDMDEARAHFKRIREVDQSIQLLQHPAEEESWNQALQRVAGRQAISPLIQGGTTRICLDRGIESFQQTELRMRFALSVTQEAMQASHWLEGFLFGSGLLVIHQPVIWNILDSWVQALSADRFQEILPLLRRSFSNFPKSERSEIWKLANGKKPELTQSADIINEELEEVVWPMIQLLLGGKSRPESES